MPVTVDIPASLRRFTANESPILINASSVDDLFKQILKDYPQLEGRIFSQDGRIRSFVNVFVNNKNIRYLQQGQTSLSEGDRISIIPAIAGG